MKRRSFVLGAAAMAASVPALAKPLAAEGEDISSALPAAEVREYGWAPIAQRALRELETGVAISSRTHAQLRGYGMSIGRAWLARMVRDLIPGAAAIGSAGSAIEFCSEAAQDGAWHFELRRARWGEIGLALGNRSILRKLCRVAISHAPAQNRLSGLLLAMLAVDKSEYEYDAVVINSRDRETWAKLVDAKSHNIYRPDGYIFGRPVVFASMPDNVAFLAGAFSLGSMLFYRQEDEDSPPTHCALCVFRQSAFVKAMRVPA